MKCGKCKHEILYTRVNFYTNRTKGPCHKVCPKRRGHKKAAKMSRTFPDGREKLSRGDWARRKHELWMRCGARCEFVSATRGRCTKDAQHAHHIIKRSKQRDDRLSNLMGLCSEHHWALHPEKRLRNPKVAGNG